MKRTLKDFLKEYDDDDRICLNIGRNDWYEQNRTATKKDLIDNDSVYLDCKVNIIDLTLSVPEFFLEYSSDKHRKVEE